MSAGHCRLERMKILTSGRVLRNDGFTSHDRGKRSAGVTALPKYVDPITGSDRGQL